MPTFEIITDLRVADGDNFGNIKLQIKGGNLGGGVDKTAGGLAAIMIATNIGGGAVTVAAGASGAAIMSTLAGIGGVVGGAAAAATAIIAAAPVVAVAGTGYAIYKLFDGGNEKSKI